jgi:hypothetical protein
MSIMGCHVIFPILSLMQSGHMTPLNCESYDERERNRVDLALITKLKCFKTSAPSRNNGDGGDDDVLLGFPPCSPFEDMLQ